MVHLYIGDNEPKVKPKYRALRIKQINHGMTHTPIYSVWKMMKQRCYNSSNPSYQYYGARGITVCDRWFYSFENFYNDMGDPKGLFLDRIDNDGHYEPSNCRWVPSLESSSHKRHHGRNSKIKLGHIKGRLQYA